jgi:hypothetical protein
MRVELRGWVKARARRGLAAHDPEGVWAKLRGCVKNIFCKTHERSRVSLSAICGVLAHRAYVEFIAMPAKQKTRR